VYELVQTCIEEATHTRGRFGLVKYMFAAQVMWLWMSRSTYIAVFELFTGKRGWHKTPHGHDETDDGVEPPLPESVLPHQAQTAGTPSDRPVVTPVRTVLLQPAAPQTVHLPVMRGEAPERAVAPVEPTAVGATP
jgi:hypothetical protein